MSCSFYDKKLFFFPYREYHLTNCIDWSFLSSYSSDYRCNLYTLAIRYYIVRKRKLPLLFLFVLNLLGTATFGSIILAPVCVCAIYIERVVLSLIILDLLLLEPEGPTCIPTPVGSNWEIPAQIPGTGRSSWSDVGWKCADNGADGKWPARSIQIPSILRLISDGRQNCREMTSSWV